MTETLVLERIIHVARTGQQWATFLHNHAALVWCAGYVGYPF